MPAREIDFASADGISWSTTIAFTIFHALAIAALFFATWDAVLVAVLLHWMCVGWGIGLGYHRLHTHRSYKTPKLLEYFFAVCGTLTLQGGPIFWTALHRIHHQHSDRDGDPHTPRDGKWWSHMLWTIFGEELHGDVEVLGKYAPDLMKDPFYRCCRSTTGCRWWFSGWRCWPSAACRGCCGASSCAWSSVSTARG